MKILHVIPTLEGGGAERQLVMLANGLASAGHEVHLAVRRCGDGYVHFLDRASVTIHPLGDLRSIHPLLFFRINALIKEIKPQIIQTWLPQMDIIGGMCAIYNSVPFVISERSSTLSSDGMGLQMYWRFYIGKRASSIVANSHGGAEIWKSKISKNCPLEVINNAVNLVSIREALSVSDFYINSDERLMLVVGRLSKEKAVDVIISSVPLLLKRWKLRVLIIGNGPLKDALQATINRLRVSDFVKIIPFQMNWWSLLKRADVLVSMSEYEGNPNVVLEAAAAGCPVIVSDIPGHREILSPSAAFFVSISDSVGLADAIDECFLHPNLSLKKATVAKQSVENRTIERMVREYCRIYSSVLSRKAKV